MFGLKKRQAAPARPVIRDPLAAIPLAPPNLVMKQDEKGLTQLRLDMPLNRVRKALVKHFGFDFSRKIGLDEVGTLYFSLVDGKRPLREIVDKMVGKLGRERQEVEKAVILFTKKLMIMNMILLHITPENTFGERHEA